MKKLLKSIETAFLPRVVIDELTADELNYVDASYQLSLLVQAVKPTEIT